MNQKLTLTCFRNLFNGHLVVKLRSFSSCFLPLCVLLQQRRQRAHSLHFRGKTKEGTASTSQTTVYTPTPLCASFESGLNECSKSEYDRLRLLCLPLYKVLSKQRRQRRRHSRVGRNPSTLNPHTKAKPGPVNRILTSSMTGMCVCVRACDE